MEEDVGDLSMEGPYGWLQPKLGGITKRPKAMLEQKDIGSTFYTTIARQSKTHASSRDQGITPFGTKLSHTLYTSASESRDALDERAKQTRKVDPFDTFYLNYLEYFVMLLIKFHCFTSKSKSVTLGAEDRKYQALGLKIIETVQQSLKKHVLHCQLII